MFLLGAAIFAIFTVGYGILSAAILYHLHQYTLPRHPFPRVVTTVFIFLSAFFWLSALVFLFRIPH